MNKVVIHVVKNMLNYNKKKAAVNFITPQLEHNFNKKG